MSSRTTRARSPERRRSTRSHKVGDAFATTEEAALHRPAAAPTGVDEKCAELNSEGSPLHEFAFVSFLALMLLAALTCPTTFQSGPVEPPAPPVQLAGWLPWLAPVFRRVTGP